MSPRTLPTGVASPRTGPPVVGVCPAPFGTPSGGAGLVVESPGASSADAPGTPTLVERLTEHPYNPSREHKRGCFPCCRLAWLLRVTPEIAMDAVHGSGGTDLPGYVRPHVKDPLQRSGAQGTYGRISQAEFEAYMHVWATAVPRFSSVANGWRDDPTDSDVAALVDALRVALKASS